MRHLLAVTLPLVGLIAAISATAPAWATDPDEALDRTIAYLQQTQNGDGGFGGRPGAKSDPLFSAWVAIALAAGGINPQDQTPDPDGTDLYAYLTGHADRLTQTTDFERAMLVTIAAGTSPFEYGGRDLVAEIMGRQLTDGSFRHEPDGDGGGGVNDTAFAIIALSTLDDPGVDRAISRGAEWLLSVQQDSGAWGIFPGASAGGSSDMTAAVIQALHRAGITGSEAEQRGWSYILSSQNRDGGFGERPGSAESNTASTAWVVQAMWVAGMEPAEHPADSGDPLRYLASMQQPDGSIRWKADQDLNPIWMTAYAAPAFAGHPMPVPSVPRSEPDSDDSEGEVDAGGGGRGAPLFSRPQPQSRGRATGGVRRTDRDDDATETGRQTPRTRPEPQPPQPTLQSSGAGASGFTTVPSDSRAEAAPPPEPDQPAPSHKKRRPGGQSETTGGETLTGRLVSPEPVSGNDGTGDRAAGAPGLAGSQEQPDGAVAITLGGALLATLALGGVAEARAPRRARYRPGSWSR